MERETFMDVYDEECRMIINGPKKRYGGYL